MHFLWEARELYLHSSSLLKSLILANCTFISIRTYFLLRFSICKFFIGTDLMALTLRFLSTGSYKSQLKWATKEKDLNTRSGRAERGLTMGSLTLYWQDSLCWLQLLAQRAGGLLRVSTRPPPDGKSLGRRRRQQSIFFDLRLWTKYCNFSRHKRETNQSPTLVHWGFSHERPTNLVTLMVVRNFYEI